MSSDGNKNSSSCQFTESKQGRIQQKLAEKSGNESARNSQKKFADNRVDQLQALNTALCFLCSVNADSSEVEHFLKFHPDALLLEGACILPEDSARYILEEHTRRCKCKGKCHQNRKKLTDLLNLGFEHYHSNRLERSTESYKLWSKHFSRLVEVEHSVRIWRRNELLLRNTMVETTVELKAYKDELNEAYRKQNLSGESSSPLALLKCSSRSKPDSFGSQVAVLEYQVDVSSINLRSVEREHTRLLQRIREGRRAQFSILKSALTGCLRHDICCLGYVAPGPRVNTSPKPEF
jgi:hypothetical protein